MSTPRLSFQSLRVLETFCSRPTEKFSGYQLMEVTGFASGTLYPLLIRLENAKWLKSEWETGNPKELGRPRKRLYQITGLGQRSYESVCLEWKQGAPA